MLTNLKITKLFGLYDYHLQFSKSEQDKIRFVTAPNGYGKSTILRFIDGIFNHHLEAFFKIPFQELIFTIDGAVLRISQSPVSSQREDVDAKDDVEIEFGFGANNPEQKIRLLQSDVFNGGGLLGDTMQQIDMFFSSETCKFVDDRRLLRENADDSELVRLSDVVKEKMKHPDDMLEKQLKVLQDIVNRSEFANKDFELNPLFGFRFVAQDDKKTKLAMRDLSSGEQHIMLMSLYMLFEAPEKAIVLIDEPEMSFHLSWQGDYLKNLRQIVALRNIQCIVATHSPIIFDSEYDLSIDLYDQMNPEN